mmetsp:Transcript_33163/g.74912  ORF Transcript_33163/g.74912 Transcript_33163/m.74912 type:complete len:201 (+) Transcript_33163:2999-3601(+)
MRSTPRYTWESFPRALKRASSKFSWRRPSSRRCTKVGRMSRRRRSSLNPLHEVSEKTRGSSPSWGTTTSTCRTPISLSLAACVATKASAAAMVSFSEALPLPIEDSPKAIKRLWRGTPEEAATLSMPLTSSANLSTTAPNESLEHSWTLEGMTAMWPFRIGESASSGMPAYLKAHDPCDTAPDGSILQSRIVCARYTRRI